MGWGGGEARSGLAVARPTRPRYACLALPTRLSPPSRRPPSVHSCSSPPSRPSSRSASPHPLSASAVFRARRRPLAHCGARPPPPARPLTQVRPDFFRPETGAIWDSGFGPYVQVSRAGGEGGGPCAREGQLISLREQRSFFTRLRRADLGKYPQHPRICWNPPMGTGRGLRVRRRSASPRPRSTPLKGL